MMGKIAATAAMIFLLATPVYSQAQQQEEKGKTNKTLLQIEQEERAQRAKDVDKDYQAVIRRSRPITTPNVAPDPWQNVRPAVPKEKTK
jgi:Flp pilus assembly protein TadD